MKKSFFIKLILILFCSVNVFAQNISKNYKAINFAVPFLTISPDAKAASMGDAGVASEGDASSVYWNTAKLVHAKDKAGVVVSYAPWLRDLVQDMGLVNSHGYYKLNDKQVITAGINYFNQGTIEFTTNDATPAGTFQSREFSLVGGFAQKLNSDLSMGLNIKFINSNLVGDLVVNGVAGKPGRTGALDLGIYYNKNRPTDKDKMFAKTTDIAYGVVIQNLGGKVNYGYSQYYIPANLKIGTSIKRKIDEENSFTFLIDFNKLLVPTPNDSINNNDKSLFSSVFSSFSDAPNGFREELSEITASFGAEYNFSNLIQIRTGYFYESAKKQGRQYITTGLGIDFKNVLKFDLAYLIPTRGSNALANTWRMSMNFAIPKINKVKNVDPEETE